MAQNDQTYRRYRSDPPTYRRNRRRRQGGGHWRVLKILAVIVVVIIVGVLAAAVGTVIAMTRNLPSLDELQHHHKVEQTSVIYDSRNHVIAELHGVQNRTVIKGADIPQIMKEATVASEDQRFYQHHGIDFQGIARAFYEDIKSGRVVQGASTITEQYVKNAYVGSERSITRKVREAVLAWQLEGKWSKDKILTAYLNIVYYGHGAYGVEAAALTYFHIHARQLKLAQASLLVAVSKLPTDYDPILYPKVVQRVRGEVLDKMANQGYITQAKAAVAKSKKLTVFASQIGVNSDSASYFTDYVTQLLVKKYGYAQTFEGGLRVYTSLDSAWQAKALYLVKHTPKPYTPNFDPSVALVAIDPKTGYIRAMVGGLDFKKQKFNLATQAHRQPGSSMKTFVLTAAVERGMDPNTTYYSSRSPVVIPMGIGVPPWIVYGDGYGGPESVKSATAISDNAVYAQLSMDVGPANTAEVAHRMGITSPLDEVPSIALGTSLVTPLEMANAYATLASGGIYRPAQAIVKVKLPDGKVDWQPSTTGERRLPAGVASTVTQVLQGVAQYGTGSKTGIYFPYTRAGKTGTTDESCDVWYVGYTPQLSAAIWMGNMKSNLPMSSAYGGDYCAPLWARFFAAALKNQPHPGFPYVSWQFKPWTGHYVTTPWVEPTSTPTPSGTAKSTPTPTSTPKPTAKPKPTPTVTPTKPIQPH